MRRTSFDSPYASRRSLLLRSAVLLSAALCALVLFYIIGTRMEQRNIPEETYGDLTARFSPTHVLTHGESTYAHYANTYTNILLIGMDDASLTSGGAYRSGAQADFLLLLSIDRQNKTITPLHIDRDTMTEAKVFGPFGNAAGTRTMQLCLSHAFGSNPQQSCELTAWAVSNLLGVSIDHYLALDMDGIAALNDALGGVTVTLQDDFSHLDPAMTVGTTLTLQGKQAEYFVRGRHGVGDNTNRGRMERQRTFIEAAISLLMEQSQEDSLIVSLFGALEPHMCTSLTGAWLMDHTYAFSHYRHAQVTSLPGTHRIGADGFMEFIPEEEALTELLIRLFYTQYSP